jgi:hypothetical protein
MKEILLNGFRLNMDYTLKLVEDIPDKEMTAQPNGFTNHPAFTLGHLVSATALTAKVLGNDYEVPKDWDELFRRKGPGDPRLPAQDHSEYPSKARLLEVLGQKYELVANLIQNYPEADFEKPYEWRFSSYMPTVGDVLYFQCLIHHSWHIGQLAEWRRMMGFDSALAKL